VPLCRAQNDLTFILSSSNTSISITITLFNAVSVTFLLLNSF
jgi:hypothetical protein